MHSKPEHFPSIPQALLLLLALFLLEYVVGAVFYDMRGVLVLSSSERYVFVMLTANAIAFTVLMQLKKMSYATLFHTAQSSVTATLGRLLPPILLLIPALVLSLNTIADYLSRLIPLSRAEEQSFESMLAGNLPATFVAICVLAPVLEEMLFRGIILRAFLHQYSRSKAIIASAMLFGLAHLNMYQFVGAYFIGLLGGWIYERTRSLLPCIALHGFYNTSVILFGVMIRSENTQLPPDTPAMYWAVALVAAAAGAWMLKALLQPSASPTQY